MTVKDIEEVFLTEDELFIDMSEIAEATGLTYEEKLAEFLTSKKHD